MEFNTTSLTTVSFNGLNETNWQAYAEAFFEDDEPIEVDLPDCCYWHPEDGEEPF